MPDFMSQLASLGRRFKGFLAFAAFVLLCLIGLFSWLFSKGSFNTVISNFGNLTKEQFFGLVLTVLLLGFITVVLLIMLAYRSTENDRDRKSILVYTVVHEEKNPGALIDEAEVVLHLPEPVVKRTAKNGSVTFIVPSEFARKKVVVTATKVGFQQASPKQLSLKDGISASIGLKRGTAKPTQNSISITIDKVAPLEVIDGNAKTIYSTAGMIDSIRVFGRGHRIRVVLCNSSSQPIDIVSIRLRLLDRKRTFPAELKYDKLVLKTPHTRLPIEDLTTPIRWLDDDSQASIKEIGEGRIRLGSRGSPDDTHQISFTVESTADGLWLYVVEAELLKDPSLEKITLQANSSLAILHRGV